MQALGSSVGSNAKSPFRLVRGTLASASRCPPLFGKPKTSRLTIQQANGVRYENKVHRALAILAKSLNATVERNPWFKFTDSVGEGICSPDAILWVDGKNESSGLLFPLVIEVKTTWVPTAADKLKGLYIPVVNEALKPTIIRSLVICKTLLPESPKPIDSIGQGTLFSVLGPPVYQWLGHGLLRW